MLIRSYVFTVCACVLSMGAFHLSKARFYKVDIHKIIKSQSLKLLENQVKENQLEVDMIKIKKQIEGVLKRLAIDKNGIIVTAPIYGDVVDLTDVVLNHLDEKDQ